jgi:hypothetical protein
MIANHSNHPSEAELQQFALDDSACTNATREHVENCQDCQKETSAYQILFSGIKEHPKPVFDFDLTGLVLSRLPPVTPVSVTSPPQGSFPTFMLATIVCCTAGIPLYLFRKNISNMFAAISSLFVYTIFLAAGIFVLLRILNMYKKFRQQMETINFY